MLVFPQLTTGAAALYPIRKTVSRRTVVNEAAGGHRVRYADPDWAVREWELRATGLTETEWLAMENLFAATSGRLESFTLLEPAGNLLKQSEAFDEPEWDNGPLVGYTDGFSDPFGTTRATRVANGAAAADEVAQIVAGPGDFQYALSAWARASGASAMTLFASTTGGSVEQEHALSGTWQRFWLPVALGLATETMTFGVRLAAGASIELFGVQVDAQPAPGTYQRTTARGGVYPEARFQDDALTVQARSTDVFDATVRMVSKGS